jgi:phospholipase C
MSKKTAAASPVGTSSQSNVVTITDQSNMITSISYVGGSLKVSEGQPKKKPTIAKAGNVFTITLDAGRQKTTPIADKFNSLCGGQNNEYAPSGGGGTPSQLNFFFGVEIQINYLGTPGYILVFLAQGSDWEGNNWWMGSPNLSNYGQPTLVCTVGQNNVPFGLSGNNDSFTFTALPVYPVHNLTNVFVLMLENHSFDNVFALSGISNIDAATSADSNTYNSTPYPVAPGAPSGMPTDPGHEFTDVVTQLAGANVTYQSGQPYPKINNSGYVFNYATTTTEGPPPTQGNWGAIMQCFDTQTDLPVIYTLATQFVICDHWFSSLPGPTWPNRYFVHGASSAGLDHSPSKLQMGEWETVDGFTYPNGSIYDALHAAQVPYALLQDTEPIGGAVPQVGSIHNLSPADVGSLTDFVSDLQKNQAYPYKYTFIEPNYGDMASGSYEGGSSQHPTDTVARGEQFIQTVYEAIRNNTSVWPNSLLIITYDEHGGFYDHVKPKKANPPADGAGSSLNQFGFDFTQLGVRVPAVIVSPWVAQGQVDKTVYDHSSVLATIETLFGLQPLTQRDKTANNLLHLISDTMRTDCPTTLPRPAPVPARPAMTAAHQMVVDQQPLPEQGNLYGFLTIMLKTELELSSRTPAEQAAIKARFQTIKTRGQARAYIESVMARAAAAKARGKAR